MKKRWLISVMALLIAASMTACTVTSVEEGSSVASSATETAPESVTDPETGSATGTESTTETETEAPETTYTVSVKTVGGVAITSMNFLVYQGDTMVTHGVTDARGQASVTLPLADDYTVKLIGSVPEGFLVEDAYAFDGTAADIVISSAVRPSTDLTGVRYYVGDIIHDFTVTTVSGETLTLSEILKEKQGVLLNFWFINCNPCRAEFPYLQAAYAQQNGIEVIAMNNTGDSTEAIASFAQQMGLTFPVVNDTEDITRAFAVSGYPTSVLIDRYGMICIMDMGSIPQQEPFDNLFAYFSAENYTQAQFESIHDVPALED